MLYSTTDIADIVSGSVLHTAIGIEVMSVSVDTRQIITPKNTLFVALPGTMQALQNLAIHHRSRFPNLETLAITGSNGKTIVKEWLYQMLQDRYTIVKSPKSYNSQIGVALSVLNIDASHNLAIFEAGISKLGEMG